VVNPQMCFKIAESLVFTESVVGDKVPYHNNVGKTHIVQVCRLLADSCELPSLPFYVFVYAALIPIRIITMYWLPFTFLSVCCVFFEVRDRMVVNKL